ncbi:MAG: Peptide chain release factor 2 [Candidatus Woesebacteria bacterium GW2011_GWB1_39_12]|uniref:Peptide chain release factor 2 n=2 Tax=Candidatus Woeseibacteriota TaxID=1752722 RepID=A0A0G0LZS9_9BACT|nr:MAG: Peptide chain release factor 2 [Candidatus Woesebacteria bacterium GW2011_GWA1_39_12]KKR00924.1 MAG: Peptide chain release factor 2 [Candidatus Woesebacteria bacterium GW2011_GWB1_39_12]
MQDIKQKTEELKGKIEKVVESFNLPEKKKELMRLETDAMDPNLWDDQEKARKLMTALSNLKQEIDDAETLKEDVDTIYELFQEGSFDESFAQEISRLEKKVDKFELKTFLSGQYDSKNAIISIHAGQGGTEAMDWANMLYRMYLRFCEKRGWKTETFDVSEGEEAGLKSVTFNIEGAYAYGNLKGEAGTHRLVRQSPFNADNLRQTSFALVEVLPELSEEDLPSVEIKEDELEWQFFRASSQGGQNVQKVSTAVRLKHKPTEIVVTAQTERFQEQNRKIALNLLRAKLWARGEAMKEKKVKELKGEYRPPSWGNQIRSYVLHPYKMVKDLRTNVETGNTEAVLDGELDEFIDAEIQKL